jgi:predicted PurR-regulated permease PerM
VSRAVLLGSYLTAILHGIAGWLAFVIFGVPRPVLWGAVMTVASFIPGIGTALVWFPAAIVLAANGHLGRGLGLMSYGVFVMGMIDYLVRPLVSHGTMRLPEYGVFVAMIGGVAAFGVVGLFIGPMVASLMLVALAVVGRSSRGAP